MVSYVIVGLIGGTVGLAELVARYRDAPAAALRTGAAWVYVAVNAAGSLAALLLVRGFGWTFGATTPQSAQLYQILVAGFAAIALFRSNLFMVKVGDNNVGVGPSIVLLSLLEAADRAVDRVRAASRSSEITRIMADVSFERAKEALPTYCLALLQNLPAEEQLALGRAVDALSGATMQDRVKALSLGLQLVNVAGVDVVQSAVNALGDDIRTTAQT